MQRNNNKTTRQLYEEEGEKKRKSYAHKGEACVEAIPTAGAQPKKPRFLNSAPDGKGKRDDEMNEFLRRSDHAGALLEPCWSARR